MGRLIMEMLGRDQIKILSIKEVYPSSLNITIEDHATGGSAEINVDLKDFIRLLNTIIINRKTQ